MVNKKKRRFRRRGRNGVRKILYILFMAIFVCAYIAGQFFWEWKRLTEAVSTIMAIIAAVAFWLEYHENQLLNEAKFITDLNEQFISNDKMSAVEWDLEKYYIKQSKDELSEEYCKGFEEKYALDKQERQQLVNYLVHLEGIAALVKNRVLHIDTIDDLMSFRYFIAVNNPIVQQLELLEYADFYKGCIAIYDDWVNVLTKQGVTPPMYDEDSNNLTRNLEKKMGNSQLTYGDKTC